MSSLSLTPDPPQPPGSVFAGTVSRPDPVMVTLDAYSPDFEWGPATWVSAGQEPVRGARALVVLDDAGAVWAFPAAPGDSATALAALQAQLDAAVAALEDDIADRALTIRLPLNLVDTALPETGADSSPELQALIDQAAAFAAADGRWRHILIPPGSYAFYSTITVKPKVSLIGPPLAVGGMAALHHMFNGPLLVLEDSTTLRNLYLQQGGAFTGAAIQHVTPDATSRGFMVLDRIVVTDPVANRGWERDVMLDGTNGVAGLRSVFFRDCQFFGAYTPGETVVLKKAVHHYWSSVDIVQAPQSTVVCGLKILNNFSEALNFSSIDIDGDIYTEAAQLTCHGRVRQNRTITFGAGSHNNIFTGDVERCLVVDNSGTLLSTSTPNRVDAPRGVRVRKFSSQTIANATLVAVTWDLEDYDAYTPMHDTLTNTTRLTARLSGKFRVDATLVFDPSATGSRAVVLRKNGSTYLGGVHLQTVTQTGEAAVLHCATEVALVSGDYVEVFAYAVGGGLTVLTADGGLGIPSHAVMRWMA